MENWKKFINEDQNNEIWDIVLLQGRTKSQKWYQIVHIPSGMVIPTDYYKAKKKSDVEKLINFLKTKKWPDIHLPNPSEETIKDVQDTIINSDFKRDVMIYVSAKTGEEIR